MPANLIRSSVLGVLALGQFLHGRVHITHMTDKAAHQTSCLLDVCLISNHQEEIAVLKTAESRPFRPSLVYHAIPFALMNTKAMNPGPEIPCPFRAESQYHQSRILFLISSSGSAPAPSAPS